MPRRSDARRDASSPPFDDRLKAVSEVAQRDATGEETEPKFILARLQALEKPKMDEALVQPEGGSADCSCNSVCACVPVKTCACDSVCVCNAVRADEISCVDGCGHTCSRGCSCNPIVWYMPCGW